MSDLSDRHDLVRCQCLPSLELSCLAGRNRFSLPKVTLFKILKEKTSCGQYVVLILYNMGGGV